MKRPFRTNNMRARLAALGLGVAVPLWAPLTLAGPVDDANRRLVDLEERTRVLASELREQTAPDPNAAERRLVEAQTYYQLKNYDDAATLCLDIIERFPNSRVHDEALVLLGDSHFNRKDYLSAKRYFLEATTKRTGSRYEQEALQRLIEIALRTGDLEGVDAHLQRLGQIPPAQLQPSVPYVRGKYQYFRERFDEALATFNGIPAENPYFLQSRYFIATIRVRRGDLAAAVQGYEDVLRYQPRNDADKEVQDLARLAVGRLFFERGQYDRARDTYNAVPFNSKHSAEARYEFAWNAIRAKDYKGAFRALDLLLLQNPDSPQAPELRLLMGNLNVRMSNYFVASETFSKTRDDFEPVYRQLIAARDQSKNDPAYYEGLLGKGLERFDIALFVPQGAVKWVKAEPDVARMLVLADDVGGLQREIRASEELVETLERAVNGAGRVAIFSDLASARVRSTEILNQAIDVRRRFLGDVRNAAAQHLSTDDRASFDRLEAERNGLDKELHNLPLTEAALRKREGQVRSEFQKFDTEGSKINVQLHAMEAELVAIEQYFINSKSDQKIRPEDLSQPVADIKAEIETLRTGLDRLRDDVVDAIRDANAAGNAFAAERQKAVRLGEIMRQQHELLLRTRHQLSGDNLRRFDERAALLRRADAIQARLTEFDQRLEAAAERRLVDIKVKLAEEKGQLGQANTRLTSVLGESQSVGGGLAQTMLGHITDRFYDLTVQSDVGLIDVSWGLKDQRTGTLSKLINQQKLELQSVEDDFRSLLEEEK